MAGMFYCCGQLTELNLTGMNTANVTTMREMFSGCQSLTALALTGFDTTNVTDMYGMFMDCASLTELDVSGFDTSKVRNFSWMFAATNAQLKTIYASELWTTSGLPEGGQLDRSNIFHGCHHLVGGNGTEAKSIPYDPDDNYTYARIDKEGDPGFFTYKAAPNRPQTTTEPAVITGDTDGDGQIGNRDAMLLIRYVNGWEGIELDLSAADIDGDGEVSARDAMIIVRYVNGWEGYDKYFQ